MTEIRTVRPEEIEMAIKLADETFCDHDNYSMGDGFPNAFSKSLEQSYGVFEKGQLVSFMGLVPSMIRIGGALLKVYSLGSVCTTPEFRGKGLANSILEKVIQHIDRAGASLLIISGRRSLYSRNNCYSYGTGAVLNYSLEASRANKNQQKSLPQDIKLREFKSEDWLKLTEVAMNRTVGYEQSVQDLAQLIYAEGMANNFKLKHKVLVAEKGSALVGFMVVGVPYGPVPKRAPLVIERAGSAAVTASLAAFALEKYVLEKLVLNVGWYEKELAGFLGDEKYERSQYSGTIRVVDSKRLIDQLQPYLRKKNANAFEQLSISQLENSHTKLVLNNGKTFTLDPQEFISLLFNPDHSLQNEPLLAELFPIPFPHPQGLNYI